MWFLIHLGALSLVEGVVAISLNASIIIINVKSLKGGWKRTPSDLIHVAMGMVNIILRGLLLGHFVGLWLSTSYLTMAFSVTVITLPFLMHYTFWLTAWLCIYYCTSISNFSHRFFPWMKRWLTNVLPYLLMFSGLGSLVISIPGIWTLQMKIHTQDLGNETFIFTSVVIASTSIEYTVVSNMLGCCAPFMVILVSLITSVSSLLRHMCNIKLNNPQSLHPKLQPHVNAIGTMVLLLTLSGIFYTAETILFYTQSLSDMRTVVCWCLIFVFPTIEAIIMIQASPKLRKAFQGAICPSKLMENNKNLGTLNLTQEAEH
ncbi:taste receptor type 2 member 9-like [Dendrobates tinctorius]|uniref:taste receptor type 2 member 9-like n=1 Tax=Dendrobates tinctorius TaxID=92724 RepID=UPI003CC94A48